MTTRGIYSRDGELFGYMVGSAVYDLDDNQVGSLRGDVIYDRDEQPRWVLRGDGVFTPKGESIGYLGERFADDSIYT